MHPYDRILRAARGEPIDRIPAVLWGFGQTYAPFAGLADRAYYADPATMLRAQLAFHERFPDTFTIPGIWPDHGSVPVASAFGCEVDFPADSPPRIISKAISDLSQVHTLPVADPKRSPYTRRILDYLAYFRDHIPDAVRQKFGFLDGHVHLGGPIDRACLIAGYEQVLLGMKITPQAVHDLLDRVVEFALRYIDAQREVVGSIKRISMSDHITGLTNRELFLEFILPRYNAIFDYADADLRFYHNETNWNHLIPDMPEIHCDVIHAGPDLDWARANRHIPQCIMGTLDPIQVLAEGTCEDIRADVRRILTQAERTTKLWFSTGGGMHPRTPPENMQCMIDAVAEFGRQP
ncbi:hypothetical protein GF339_12285 [candidate division KSB3 bacterium]|uniref:Uroporphyrinogen decarboxylase (URO-D) domain-containing protein n=1 Tax=candidate division KSB3 bacterium TaxID=2044937 RepID=A0A9D5JW33_9BACT|nr:hypothetical protein [candidate division KSB3 bacterium]MBD3325359.1 hypothetical protein [candidate division KSB3 bacterium]